MEGFDTSTMTYTGVSGGLQLQLQQQQQQQQQQHSQQYDDAPDAYAKMLMPMSMPTIDHHFDHHSNFDAHTYAGSDDMYQHHHNPHQHNQHQQSHVAVTPASLKRFSTNLDDAYSDVVSAFDQPINQETHEGETTVDRDHKLLSFSLPTMDYVLLDYTYRQTSISMTAQLHGMFFLAESPWANPADGGGTTNAPPAELTCYRRNLFQLTGNITLPRSLHYILTNDAKQLPIVGQELVVTATESTEGNSVKLISVPWKTPANVNGPATVDDKVEREPPAIPLDLSAPATMQEVESGYATIPFQWKRLQFRIATANNGRRKELQQHFVLHLSIMATLATGGRVAIATARSGAIIVRGRSPRNFQSRKDTPLTGAGNHARKSSQMTVGAASAVGAAVGTQHGLQHQQHMKNEPTSAPVKTEGHPAPPMSVTSFYDPNDFSMPAGLFDNTFLPDPHQQSLQQHQHHQGAMTALPAEPLNIDAVAGGYALSSPDLSRPTPGPGPSPAHPNQQLQQQDQLQQLTPPATSMPTKLSLVDEDTPKQYSLSPNANRYNTPPSNSLNAAVVQNSNYSHPAKRMATMAPPPPLSNSQRLPSSFSLNVVSSPDESADLLYEYFPLSLDDWMPPVDAVYRPHVVHHIKPLNTGPEGAVANSKAGGVGGPGSVWAGRSKRYFSEDVG